MFKKVISIVIAGCFLFSSSTVAFAQQATAPGLQKRLDEAEVNLKKVEALMNKLDKAKVMKAEDIAEFDAAIGGHTAALKSAYGEALQDAEKSAKAGESPINLRSLDSFEKTVNNHEMRVKKIVGRVMKIDVKVKRGEIVPDKPVLDKMTPEEKQKFKEYLTPEGRNKLQALQPGLFELSTPAGHAQSYSWGLLNGDHITEFCRQLPEQIGDFFVTPAEAAVGAAVTLACTGTVGAGCIVAIALGVVAEEVAEQARNNCLAQHSAWWDWGGRAICWTVYVAAMT